MSLILNPSADVDTSYTNSRNSAVITRDTGVFNSSPASFKIVTPGVVAFEGIAFSADPSVQVLTAVTPGVRYRMGGWVRGNAGDETNLIFSMSWIDSSLAFISSVVLQLASISTSFQLFQFEGVPPGNATWVLPEIETGWGNAANAYTYWVDDVALDLLAAPRLFPLELGRGQLNPRRQPWMLTRALNIGGSPIRNLDAPTTGAATVTATVVTAKTLAVTAAGVAALSVPLARTKKVAATPTGTATVTTVEARARTLRATPAGVAAPTGSLGTPVSATYGASYYGVAHYGTTDTPGLKAFAAVAAGTATPTVSVRRAQAVRATPAGQAQTTVGFRGTALLIATPAGQAATTAAVVSSNASTGLTPRNTDALILVPRPPGTV